MSILNFLYFFLGLKRILKKCIDAWSNLSKLVEQIETTFFGTYKKKFFLFLILIQHIYMTCQVALNLSHKLKRYFDKTDEKYQTTAGPGLLAARG